MDTWDRLCYSPYLPLFSEPQVRLLPGGQAEAEAAQLRRARAALPGGEWMREIRDNPDESFCTINRVTS